MSSLCPTYHASSSKYICKQWLPAGFQFYQMFPVRLSSVVSPINFWVQMEGPSCKDRLDELEEKMCTHYNNASREEVALHEIKEEMFVAIRINDKIRRARVDRIHFNGNRNIATVFHVDYGIITKENCKKLLKLERKFFYLPQQAIWATLANTVPVDGKLPWSIADSSRFAFMCQGKTLEAQVSGVCKRKLKLFLILNDTSNPPRDININDALIENGIAAYGETINLETY